MIKPTEVNILGKVYTITYVDKPSDVDINKHNSAWGQIDYWTRTIRIYDNGRTQEDIIETIIHEIIHGISSELNIKDLEDSAKHDQLSILALALSDVLVRNDWLK